MVDPSVSPPAPSDRTIVTLIRHGESMATVNRRIGGKRSCRGLSPLGRTQSERLRDRLLGHDRIDADALIVSDFTRAIETADIIRPAFFDELGERPIEQWQAFGEHDPGPDIDGMTFDDYVRRFGTPDWDGDPDVEIFPGGETTRRFHERVERGLEKVCSDFAGRRIVIVCHGGVVDIAFRILLSLPRTVTFELHTMNTALTTLSGPALRPDVGGSPWRLDRYNDAAHLAGLPDATPRRS